MNALKKAAELAERFEGFSAYPYRDVLASEQTWTIGYGSTTINGDGVTPVTADTPPIDKETAALWLENEMARGLRTIDACVTVLLTENQRAALLDFIYNVGEGAFRTSTLRRKLQEGDYAGAADEFVRWDHAGGRVVPGLLRRRLAEQALFETPDNS